MTMPYGSTEEPTVEETMPQSVPVHVVSSDAKPGKSIGTEFGRWRTFLVTSAVGQDSATPGAKRLLNRSLRRHRAIIKVNSQVGGGTPQTTFAPANPAAGTNFTYTNNTGVSQTLLEIQGTFTADAVVANRFLSVLGFDAAANQIFKSGDLTAVVANTSATLFAFQGAAQQNGATGTVTVPLPLNVVVPPGGTVQLQASGLDVGDTWTNVRYTLAAVPGNSATDGVIIGSREEINSGLPMVPGNIGGYLQIGDNVRLESQAEYWVAYPSTNIAPVLVSVCDEIYASDPEAWKENQ